MNQFAAACLGLALLTSCQKDDVVICGEFPQVATFAALRAAAPARQTFIFDLGQAQSIRTASGSTVAFGASAFVLPNGAQATGLAELRVREIRTVPDMLLANMPTSTTAAYGQQMLLSGGEFNLQVWQGTTRLLPAPVGSGASTLPRLMLTTPVPTSGLDTTRMMVWNMPGGAFSATTRDSSAGWRLVSTRSGAPIRVPASGGYYSASLPLDSIGNWNIDQLWHMYQRAGVSTPEVEVPTASSAIITRVYFRPIGFNGLARGQVLATPARWGAILPIGAPMVAVVLQEKAGQLYYGTQRFTVQANQPLLSPTLEALSVADIVQRIRQL